MVSSKETNNAIPAISTDRVVQQRDSQAGHFPALTACSIQQVAYLQAQHALQTRNAQHRQHLRAQVQQRAGFILHQAHALQLHAVTLTQIHHAQSRRLFAQTGHA